MSLTMNGVICDVCGEKIILIPGKKLKPFTVKGINMIFHQHEKCRPLMMRAHKARNWKLLPDGPLKEAYFAACKDRGIKV